jgi:hypothetical protein
LAPKLAPASSETLSLMISKSSMALYRRDSLLISMPSYKISYPVDIIKEDASFLSGAKNGATFRKGSNMVINQIIPANEGLASMMWIRMVLSSPFVAWGFVNSKGREPKEGRFLDGQICEDERNMHLWNDIDALISAMVFLRCLPQSEDCKKFQEAMRARSKS